jgi:outer membrane protein insertion porin family
LKPAVLQEDFEKIGRYYRSLGYLDAQVKNHEIELGDNGKDVTLRVFVQEGPQYRVGNVEWSGNTVFTDGEIARVVKLFLGAPFDEAAFEATTQALYELYQDRGYFYFTATPRRDIQGQVVNVSYQLSEGQQARLAHVRIVGNTKTQDKVILREFSMLPGSTFDRSMLQRSLRDVFQLGFFEDVNIPPEGIRPRDDGSVDLEIKVVEKQTGQLGAGAGYSAVNALTGFFEMAETNLFGQGKRISFRWEFSKVRNDVNFSYTQPWLFDSPTTLTVDLFNTTGRTRVNSYYRVRRTGGALRIGRRLHALDYTTVSWRYRAENVAFTDISELVSDAIRSNLVDGRRRGTGITLRRNSTDSPFFPTRGSEAEWSVDLFGTFLGGNVSFLHNEVDLAWYQRLGRTKFTLAFRSRAGVLTGLENRPVPNDELFRLGGVFIYPVRGYDEFEIVPTGNEPYVGGQAMSLFVTELRYPFTPRVHGALFFDAGNTWNTLSSADLSDMRKGAGAGIRVEVPMIGLLGLDYAYGFDRVDLAGRKRPSWNFHFRFGNFF